MKLFLIGLAFIAGACAQLSSEYLPPAQEYGGAATNVVETNFLESEPAHTLEDDGYRYKAVKRLRYRHRRDVSELSNDYLPPHVGASSAPGPVYSAPASYESAASYSEPAASYETYEAAGSEPAHTFSSNDGYRYKTVKRYRHRRRRDVSELSNDYLPPHVGASSAPAPVYSAPASYESAASYSEPAASYETYEAAGSEPAHTFSSNDGYRYKTVKRYRHRRRRDVSELSNDYLPPHVGASSAPGPVYSAPASYESAASYSEPAASYETYEAAGSEPAHTFSSNDGYRYKTVKRYRHRRRRDVSELSNDYLPPHVGASSAPAPVYSAPASYESAASYSEPAVSYETYEAAGSEPAHTFSSNDGYRYKTVKRYRHRRRRDVSELSNDYLPPHVGASSAPGPVYSAPASYESAASYSEPAASYETYEAAGSEPAHTFSSNDGYRYKTVKRYRHRRRRDVSELSNDYLPPHVGASSAPGPVYSAPASYESAASYSEPAVQAYEPSYDTSASEPAPAHSFSSDDGYRYKTVKRYRLRRRRDVN